jgi:cysteine-rich repeat protein
MKTKLLLLSVVLLGSCELLLNRFGPERCNGFVAACEADGVRAFCNGDDFIERELCEAGCLADFSECSLCGNGIVDASLGEVCDDGDLDAIVDGCNQACQIDAGFTCVNQPSECAATCGDTILDKSLGEVCDDGNSLNDDGCDQTCQLEVCGDGVINFSDGANLETCDDGNSLGGDGCSSSCTIENGFTCNNEPSECVESCGNNSADPGETCDDGCGGDGCSAADNGDTCDQFCQQEICGNTFIQNNEECDDGNTTSGDGCNNQCLDEFCGDGIENNSNTETCDDGNNINGDGCDANCEDELCGDGNLTLDEGCDDGNIVAGDGCDQNCQPESCGNSVIELGEECDDGNNVNNDECNNNCQFTCTTLSSGTLASFRDTDTGHCYVIPNQLRNWNDAKNDCNNRNSGSSTFRGHMATITTAKENAIVRALLVSTELWIGLTDQTDGTIGSQEGRFRWITGERLSPFMNFPNGEPSGGGGENCTSFLANSFFWHDVGCGAQFPYVCEFDFGKQCGNGIIEQGEKCYDGNTVDNDGCSANCQTFSCSQEAGAEQSLTANISDGCFVLFDTNRSFNAAQNDCKSRGGNLASATTSAENTILDQLENSNISFWIGLQDPIVENSFIWSTGEGFSFEDFPNSQPDDSGNEDCVEYTNNDDWNDLNCNTSRFYVCEF